MRCLMRSRPWWSASSTCARGGQVDRRLGRRRPRAARSSTRGRCAASTTRPAPRTCACRRASSLRACVSTSAGMPALAISSSRRAMSSSCSSSSPSSFWIVLSCSRSRNLRCRSSSCSLVRSPISCDRRSTSMRRDRICSTFCSRSSVSSVSSSDLLLDDFRVDQAGHDVGQLRPARASPAARAPARPARPAAATGSPPHARASCRPSASAWVDTATGSSMSCTRAAMNGIALDQRLDAKALHALAHRMVHLPARLDVLHDLGHRADIAQRIAPRVVDLRVLLQHDAQRRLRAQRVLHRSDRAGPADADRHQHVRKQHHIAHRHERDHPFGQAGRNAWLVFHAVTMPGARRRGMP